MNKLLLIPTAKLVPLELQAEFGNVPPAILPVYRHTVLEYLTKKYIEKGYKIVLAIHEGAQYIHEFLAGQDQINAICVDVGPTKSLGETILNAIQAESEMPDEIVIHFADTLLLDVETSGDKIYYAKQIDLFRWTAFVMNNCNNIISIVEKDIEKQAGPEGLPVFVGVFSFSQPKKLLNALKSEIEIKNTALDPFYRALWLYIVDARSNILQEVSTWLDFGHLDTYYEARRFLVTGTRYFNKVKIDENRAIIRKESRNSRKFIDEVKWYLKLPNDLQYAAPRVFNYSLDYTLPYIELEYYGYPSLSDLFLFGHADKGTWVRALMALNNMTNDFQRYRVNGPKSKIAEALKYMYVTKTKERLNTICKNTLFGGLIDERVIINGQEIDGVSKIVNILESNMHNVGLLEANDLCVIHGDLCLGNILYDRRNRIVKLIDPRGSFGGFDIYGDVRYDLAKLFHSFEGDYDLILAGRFKAGWDNNGYYFRVNTTPHQKELKELWKDYAMHAWPGYFKQARIIQSLLFLSMVPLHKDRPEAQIAFLAKGLSLYQDAIAQYIKE